MLEWGAGERGEADRVGVVRVGGAEVELVAGARVVEAAIRCGKAVLVVRCVAGWAVGRRSGSATAWALEAALAGRPADHTWDDVRVELTALHAQDSDDELQDLDVLLEVGDWQRARKGLLSVVAHVQAQMHGKGDEEDEERAGEDLVRRTLLQPLSDAKLAAIEEVVRALPHGTASIRLLPTRPVAHASLAADPRSVVIFFRR